MALDIYTNNYALVAQNSLSTASTGLSKSIERLSTGLRINHASDDASGLAISEKLRGQIRGLAKASMNAQDAVSFLQTAEGGMEVIGDMLQRMRELAVQAGNGTYTSSDRAELQKEVSQLKNEINRISSSTEYNTKKLLTGDAAALWSTNSPNNIEAIVRGVPAEGNYKLSVTVSGGQAYEYKSNELNLLDQSKLQLKDVTGGASVDSITSTAKAGANGSLAVTVDPATTAPAISYGAMSGGFAGKTIPNPTATPAAVTQNGYYVVSFTKPTNGTVTASNFSVTFYNGSDGGAKNIAVAFDAKTGGTAAELTLTNTYDNAGTPATDSFLFTGFDYSTVTSDGKFILKSQAEVKAAAAGTDGPSISIGTGTTGSVKAATDKDGNGSVATLDLDAQGNVSVGLTTVKGLKASATGTINLTNRVTENTKLSDIKQFTNADGRMILDNAQTLTIFANGQQKDVSVQGSDTVKDFMNKLNAAFNEIGLGNNVATFNPYGDTFPDVFKLMASNKGDASRISVIGDESLINALGLTTLKKGENPVSKIIVNDAHTGRLVGEDTVGDNVLRNVIKGIDVRFKNIPDTGGTYYLHVKNNETKVQVGANEGQSFDVSIGEINTSSLDIDDAFVLTLEDSQKAITKFDQALSKVVSARATIGAQINRLEYTSKNLSISHMNLVAAESRIRDLDVASESTIFAKYQILQSAAQAMLAQANQIPQSALQLIGR